MTVVVIDCLVPGYKCFYLLVDPGVSILKSNVTDLTGKWIESILFVYQICMGYTGYVPINIVKP